MGVEVRVSADCDPGRVYAALLKKQGGSTIPDEEMEPWAVVADAPYATYLEFGTMPTTKERGQNQGGVSEVMMRFIAWARAKGLSDREGRAMYEYAMKKGILPNPFLRPAMYTVIDDIEGGLWRGPVTPMAVADEIAACARRIVLDDHMGSGDLTDGTYLYDLIRSEPAKDSIIPLHPNADHDFFWTRGGQWSGVGGKTAYIRSRTR